MTPYQEIKLIEEQIKNGKYYIYRQYENERYGRDVMVVFHPKIGITYLFREKTQGKWRDYFTKFISFESLEVKVDELPPADPEAEKEIKKHEQRLKQFIAAIELDEERADGVPW